MHTVQELDIQYEIPLFGRNVVISNHYVVRQRRDGACVHERREGVHLLKRA